MYTTEEKHELLGHLEKTREGLLLAVTGMSDQQSHFKPAANSWSVANVVEHLAIVEDLVAMRLEQLPSLPDRGEPTFAGSDAVLLEKTMDRSAKFQTPERGQPTGKALGESLDRLSRRRKQILEFIQSAPADFRKHTMPHPVLGQLDGHQWLLALAGHCARHVEQINEAKANPGFPQAE